MLYKYVGRNVDISQKLKNMTEKKLERLSKFFAPDTQVIVTFKEEGRSSRVEVTIPVKGTSIRAEVSSPDPYTGLDDVMEKLERQISRHRGKLSRKAKADATFRNDYFADIPEDEEKSKVVRAKVIEAVTMDREEACLQMELIGHDFYIYKDKETDRVSVVYRRREEDTYGLIEVR